MNSETFGIRFDRKSLRERITQRLEQRLEKGMLKEVQDLLAGGIHPEKLKFYGLEYKFMTMHLMGELIYSEMFQKLNTAIHQFAKKQETWFRRMERNGFHIHWIDGHLSLEDKMKEILGKL